MLVPLLVMAVAFTGYYLTLLLLRVKSEIYARRIRAIRLMQVYGEESAAAERGPLGGAPLTAGGGEA